MNVFVSRRANQNFLKILSYLQEEWGTASVEKFKYLTNEFLDILESFPEIGSLENPEKNVRGFQLTKQTRVFYTIRANHILILSFYDVRQNPLWKKF